MRYGIFSDVHSNLEAFKEAVAWFKEQSIDKYIFLGDIVGYGAQPNEAVALLRKLGSINIAGNHDWACIDKFDIELLNSYAREAIIWTKSILEEENKLFLKKFMLTYEDDEFICVHSSLYEPSKFHYVLNNNDARILFSASDKKLCFIGHSHRAGVYAMKENNISYSREEKVHLENNTHYIFNAGSVGQPRDGDNRGCVCVYDTKEKLVAFHRFEYNIKKAADKILNAGLPHFLAGRLYAGR